MVLLTRERIQETLDDAVERGRVTAGDADDLVRGLVELGRRQTDDVMRDLEQLLGRGQSEVESRTKDARKAGTAAAERARRQVGDATARARKRAAQTADPVLARADQARRVVGVGPSFPLTGYDDLTAAQVVARLDTLSPAELRKVRDYERRNANRKSVLSSIESKLG